VIFSELSQQCAEVANAKYQVASARATQEAPA